MGSVMVYFQHHEEPFSRANADGYSLAACRNDRTFIGRKGFEMRYRKHTKTGDQISEIGMGSAYLYEADHDEAIAALRTAYEGGINYFDLAAGDGLAFTLWGEALADVRKQVLYQIHFGADYSKGTYGWSLDLDTVKKSVEWQLRELKTDYIDYGFIHCQDEQADWETYRKNGIYRYIQSL